MKEHLSNSYQIYLLKLWQDGESAPWRAVLECAQTGEYYPFAGLTELFAFLETRTGTAPPTAPAWSSEDNEEKKKVK